MTEPCRIFWLKNKKSVACKKHNHCEHKGLHACRARLRTGPTSRSERRVSFRGIFFFPLALPTKQFYEKEDRSPAPQRSRRRCCTQGFWIWSYLVNQHEMNSSQVAMKQGSAALASQGCFLSKLNDKNTPHEMKHYTLAIHSTLSGLSMHHSLQETGCHSTHCSAATLVSNKGIFTCDTL